MRDSILSPLAQSHAQRMASQITPRSERHTAKHPESSLESSSSHNESLSCDASSLHSNRSSETSVENDTSQTQAKSSNSSVYLPKRQIVVPGGTLYSSPRITTKLAVDRSQCHAPPTVPPRTYVHRTSSEEDPVYQPTCALHTTQRKPRLNRKSSKRRGPRENLTADAGMAMISEAIPFASGALPTLTRTSSPTLSEAECDLHAQLASSFGSNSDPRANVQNRTSLAECNPVRQSVHEPLPEGGEWIDIKSQPRRDSATVVLPDTPPPVLPRKSSKRQLAARRSIEVDRLPRDHIASQMMQRCSRSSTTLTLMIPQYKKRSSVDLVFSPLSIATNNTKPTITPAGAEKVILGIFRHLDHFNDLFAAAFINQGFYRVFKRHELELLKSTLRNMSPPAWEFREIAFPRHDLLHAEDLEMTRPEEEYTPASYLKLHKEDIQVIRTIKSEILEKCQSFVRPEISAALMSTCPAESARVDDALWRIWTFCKIFGSGKGREEDIVAQMDWLNGGVLVHQATCTFSIMSTDFMSDTLVGAPECFGQGNGGGLNAEQLFDMMELWTCLSVLLQNFEGRTVQARQAGIYDNTDIRGGDIDGEEMMLDEWIYHLTFGLATVVKLTGPYHPSDPKAFDIAAENGWVNWKPPVLNGTRQHFLKEAARRVYEDKIAHTYAKISIRDVQRQQSKIRIQKHINELQHRKKNGENRPTIRMSQERPMSEWDTVIRNLTRPPLPPQGPGNDIITHVPTLRSASAEEVAKSVPLPASWSTSSRTSSPPRRTVAQPLLPTPPSSTVPSNHDRRSVVSNLPSIGEQPPSLSRLTVAQLLSPSPSASAVQYNRDLYTMGSVSSVGSSPRRMYAQPLLPTPSTSTEPNSREWHRYSTGTFMPSILEDPLHHPISEPRGPPHPAFRPHPMSLHYRERHMHQGSQSSGSASSTSGSVQQNEQQHHMYGSRSHENTADKAIYRIVEMGFTAAEAREALRLTDLGNGLRVDRAVELLLSRQT